MSIQKSSHQKTSLLSSLETLAEPTSLRIISSKKPEGPFNNRRAPSDIYVKRSNVMIKSQAYKILARLGLFFILGFYSSLHPNALTDAVKAANLDLVQQLVGKDNSLVNLRDETGTPPLLYAYQQDKTKIAQFLIFSGADGHVDSNSLL